jgi:tetrahydromethanopterin S-methyltransferase subunit E
MGNEGNETFGFMLKIWSSHILNTYRIVGHKMEILLLVLLKICQIILSIILGMCFICILIVVIRYFEVTRVNNKRKYVEKEIEKIRNRMDK